MAVWLILIIVNICLFEWSYAIQPIKFNNYHKITFIDKENFSDPFKILNIGYDQDDVEVYKFLDTQKNSYIVFVKDNEGNHYIVKQERTKTLTRQLRAISETLCAYIAHVISIPSQCVTLLPPGFSFPGKFITKRIATLHTLVPGQTVRSSTTGKYSKIDIKQTTDPEIPFEKQGFTERTIFFMSQHLDLPKIVALDTFTGNKDRNKANILYDSGTDSFYAIDMALMYDAFSNRKPIAQIACEHVIRMLEQKKQFTTQEQQGLSLYRSTLQDLVREFPPKIMFELLDSLVVESGLLAATSPFAEKEVISLINTYKRAIKQSYTETKKLIYLLFLLMNKQH